MSDLPYVGLPPASQLTTQVDTTPPLSGVLSNSATGRLDADNLFRRYGARMSSYFNFQDLPRTDVKTTMWQVGRAQGNARRLLRRDLDQERSYPAAMMSGTFVMEDVIMLCRRFGANTPQFQNMELAGVGAQLGRAMAWYVQTGGLTCAQIRGGRAVRVRCLANTDVPMSPGLAHVFIPRMVDEFAPGIFAVLTACVNAYEGTVYTDVLEVTAANQPVILEPTGNIAALAVYCGMRMLLSQCDAMHAGGVMAYAIAKGCHEGASVVGHSDEGSYIRDVIRAGDFARPYGAITPSFFNAWVGLPAPTQTSESTFVALFDSIVLLTAAASAISDPLTTVEGRSYPTVFTDGTQAMGEAGEAVVGVAANSVQLSCDIAMSCGAFVDIYLSQVARIFHTQNSGPAKMVLRAQFAQLSGTNNRHLRFSQVAPYYWVEPTGLFTTVWDTPANLAGLGVFVGTMSEAKMSFFEKHTVLQETSNFYFGAFSWRSARTNPLMVVMASHRLNGLGHFVPTQFSADKALLKGGGNTFAAARAAGDDLVAYSWAPNQTTFPHPAAFMYLGSAIGMRVATCTFDVNGLVAVHHVPTVHDLSGEISAIASRPSRIDNHDLRIVDRTTRRNRSTACNALSNARLLRGVGMCTGGEITGVGDFEPMVWHTRDVVAGGGDMIRDVRHLAPSDGIDTRGPVMPHFISATPDRFRIAYFARVQGGGGGPVVGLGREVVVDVRDVVALEQPPAVEDDPGEGRIDIPPVAGGV